MDNLHIIKNKWAVINGFLDWQDYISKHDSYLIPESIVNELIELALNFDYE